MPVLLVSFWSDTLLVVIFGFVLFYLWVQHRYGYWRRKGIEGLEPKFLVGSLSGFLTFKFTIGEIFANIYNQTKHLAHTGGYLLLRPCWIVNDLELIKRIFIKDFAHFTDHGHDFNYKIEPLSENLFNIKGETWKRMRVKLTPAFTSSRMKQMFGIVESCSRTMVESMDDGVVVDVKDILGKYATDVIGGCAFGIECNSFKYPDAEFRKYGKRMVHLPLHKAIWQSFLYFFSPASLKMIPISIFGNETNEFFISNIQRTIEYREKHKIVKKDVLQLLIQLMKQSEIDADNGDRANDQCDDGSRLSIEQVAAQAFTFFFAGFESTSSTGGFALLELAKNLDIQRTLLMEIDDVLDKHDGKLTYDSTSDMSYLTMVIEETMRKYPALPVLFRMCTKDYTIPNTNIVIDKDTMVLVPLYGIHRDERFFPDPEKFDPERFTPENKESRNQFSYMPFGEGPRSCIGSRFGMMQTRLALASLLSKFEVSLCDKSPSDVVYDKKTFALNVEGPIYLKLSVRVK